MLFSISKEICNLSFFHLLSAFLHSLLRALVVSFSQGSCLGLGLLVLKGAMLSRMVAQVELNRAVSSSVLMEEGGFSMMRVLGAAMRASEKFLAVSVLMWRER